MKIAITATGADLEASVDPRFGRCACFLFVETDDLSFEAVENPNIALGGGAGIQSAQLMSAKGVTHVLTGNCGPNAHQTLSAAGIVIVVGCSGTVRDVIERCKTGQLAATDAPNVASHFGMGASAPDPNAPTADANPTFNPGMNQSVQGMGGGGGRGMGMGGGRGRGMGGGGGGGGGRGMGMGGGGGGGRGMGMGGGSGAVGNQPLPINGGEDELSVLKQQAEIMMEQMRQIQQKIQQLEQEKRNG